MDAEKAFRTIENKRRLLYASYIVTMCLGLSSLVALFMYRNLFFPLLIITLLFYLLVVLTLDRRYSKEFIRSNLLLGTARGREGAVVNESSIVPEKDIADSALFPLPSSGKRKAITGMSVTIPVDDDSVTINEILSYYRLPAGSDKHKVALIKGIWIKLPLRRSSRIDAGIIRKNAIHPAVRNNFYRSKGFVLEDGADEWDGCLFIARNEKSMERLRALLPRIQELYETCSSKSGSMLLRIADNCLYLLNYGRTLDFDAPVRKGLTMEVLESDRIPEFWALRNFADYLEKS